MDLKSNTKSDELAPPKKLVEDKLIVSSDNDISEPKYTLPETKGLEPLTKNQLLQAIEYLIKNDSDFMVKIHKAYVKSLLQN